MATSVKTAQRSVVTLVLSRSAPALIAFAENIVKRMTGNASFSSPAPSLATVTAAVDDLRAAEAVATSRIKGAVTALRQRRRSAVERATIRLAVRRLSGPSVDVADPPTSQLPRAADAGPILHAASSGRRRAAHVA